MARAGWAFADGRAVPRMLFADTAFLQDAAILDHRIVLDQDGVAVLNQTERSEPLRKLRAPDQAMARKTQLGLAGCARVPWEHHMGSPKAIHGSSPLLSRAFFVTMGTMMVVCQGFATLLTLT